MSNEQTIKNDDMVLEIEKVIIELTQRIKSGHITSGEVLQLSQSILNLTQGWSNLTFTN